MKATAPNLRIVTEDLVDLYGDAVPKFKLNVTSDSYLEFQCSVINDGDEPWCSGDPATFPERYLSLTPYNLAGFIRADVFSGTKLVASAAPYLFDADSTVPVAGAIPPPSRDSFVGFWIDPNWVNLTTENNVGAIDMPAGNIRFDSPLPPGDYKLEITLDPNNWWGQFKKYSQAFTIAGTQVTAFRALKTSGKR